MYFLFWLVQVARQQILLSFSTLETRKKDFQDLHKLNVEIVVSLTVAFILRLRLTAPKTTVAEE